MKKVIKFYRKNCYGINREFIHPENNNESFILFKLTGQKTITPFTRSLIEKLTDNQVNFLEVIAP